MTVIIQVNPGEGAVRKRGRAASRVRRPGAPRTVEFCGFGQEAGSAFIRANRTIVGQEDVLHEGSFVPRVAIPCRQQEPVHAFVHAVPSAIVRFESVANSNKSSSLLGLFHERALAFGGAHCGSLSRERYGKVVHAVLGGHRTCCRRV